MTVDFLNHTYNDSFNNGHKVITGSLVLRCSMAWHGGKNGLGKTMRANLSRAKPAQSEKCWHGPESQQLQGTP